MGRYLNRQSEHALPAPSCSTSCDIRLRAGRAVLVPFACPHDITGKIQIGKSHKHFFVHIPEQVIQHHRNWGMPQRRGREPPRVFE